jgi:hypothetical protein
MAPTSLRGGNAQIDASIDGNIVVSGVDIEIMPAAELRLIRVAGTPTNATAVAIHFVLRFTKVVSGWLPLSDIKYLVTLHWLF